MSKRRFRVKEAEPGQLIAYYGRADKHSQPSICYAFGGKGACSGDARILAQALESNITFENSTLVLELESRGYDLTTLKFSIERKKDDSVSSET